MTDEPTGADRLDELFDAWLRGGPPESIDGVDPALLATFERIQAIDARMRVDPRLKHDLWREMMSVIPVEQRQSALPAPNEYQPLVVAPRRSRASRRRTGSRRATGEIVTTLGLLVLLVTGLVGYQQFGNDEPPRQPLAAVENPASPTPTVSGCETQPRDPGTVAALAGSQPTLPAYLPRLGNDPVYSEAIGSDEPVDGDMLIMNSEPDDTARTAIEQTLDQLVACRYYAFSDPSTTDLDGRYWALYSDDYFRRELSGYREAGLPLDLGTFWMPSTVPAVLETRLLADGERVLAILEKPTPQNPNRVVIFVRSGDRWLVDEAGMARMPADNVMYDVAPATATGRLHRLDIGLYDAAPPATPVADAGERFETVCDALSPGSTLPCGANVQRFGPYLYNEFPANTDFTVTLYNLGQHPKRIRVPDLGIDELVVPGDAVTLALNAEDGQYLYLVFQGDDPEPVGAGIFTFMTFGDSPDEQPGVG